MQPGADFSRRPLPFRRSMRSGGSWLERVIERLQPTLLASAHDIERGVYRGAMQITLQIAHSRLREVATGKAQKNRLQHVFGIAHTAGNAVRRPQHEPVVLAK